MAVGAIRASKRHLHRAGVLRTRSHMTRNILSDAATASIVSSAALSSMTMASATGRTSSDDMLRITCPVCGERDYTEFRYGGDATKQRPAHANEDRKVWHDYVFLF